jgi:cation:H+ antiporter
VASATLLVVIATVALLVNSSEPQLNRGVGILFLALLAAYLYITYYWAKQGENGELNEKNDAIAESANLIQSWLLVMGGVVTVIIGARGLIPCASEVALRFGVPDDVIAATIVAFGTSLPELMTAIAALRKGYPEITVGNIIGADVLNCLFVIGAAAAAVPLAIPANFYYFHFPAMLIILYSFRIFISMNKKGTFQRWQGVWLLGVYVMYVFMQYTLKIGSNGA